MARSGRLIPQREPSQHPVVRIELVVLPPVTDPVGPASFPLVASPPGTTPFDVSIYDWFLKYTR